MFLNASFPCPQAYCLLICPCQPRPWYPRRVMEPSSSRKLIVPIILGLVVVGVLIFGLYSGGDDQSTQEEEEGGGPSSIWRCHACGKISGQNWQTCRNVTGRGTEEAARDLVKQRVCEEASDPQSQCSIATIKCRELSPGAVKGAVSDERED